MTEGPKVEMDIFVRTSSRPFPYVEVTYDNKRVAAAYLPLEDAMPPLGGMYGPENIRSTDIWRNKSFPGDRHYDLKEIKLIMESGRVYILSSKKFEQIMEDFNPYAIKTLEYYVELF